MLHPVYALRQSGHQADYDAFLAYEALQDYLANLGGDLNHYDKALRHFAASLYGTALLGTGKNYYLDKTPRYYFIITDLARLFPHARFILLLRNPLAVLASVLETRVKGHWPLLGRYRHDLLTAPLNLLAGADLLADQAAIVHYEKLVANPEEEVRTLCDRLNLTFHMEMVTYGRQAAPAGRMGDETQVDRHNRPMTDRLDRWLDLGYHRQTRHFAEAYLQSLGPDLVNRLGYDSENLNRRLAAFPTKEGKIEVRWSQLFQPDNAWQKRQVWTELALLEHRRLVQMFKRFLHIDRR
jgi:hypothetical protein